MPVPIDVYALWDNVIIYHYNGNGFPITAVNQALNSQGTVSVVGPNVDRVSVGQLVVYKKDISFYTLDTQTWDVVPQSAILVIYKSEA